jgi:hypothetical protein
MYHAVDNARRCADGHITLTLFYDLLSLLSNSLLTDTLLQGSPSEADSANEGWRYCISTVSLS